MLTKESVATVKKEVPPALDDRYIIRCTGAKFGNSSKNNPMITTQWEVCGILTREGIKTEIIRNQEKYEIAGLFTQPMYFTLLEKSINSDSAGGYFKFLRGLGLPEQVDETNPDLSHFDDLACSAVLKDREFVERKAPQEGQEIGDPILDDDGKEMKRRQIVITSFGRKYIGELPTPY